VSFAYGYNQANQRVSQTASDKSWWFYPSAASTTGYTANSLDQYTAVGAVTPTYDGNGNLTSDGTFTFGYDAENRLISASGPGNTASYAFDAQGRRKSKTVNGVSTFYLTDADNREVLEYSGASGQILHSYTYGLGPNEVLSDNNVPAATRVSFTPDVQGSIQATLESGTGVLSAHGYQSFGQSASTSGSFRYTGQRIDAETGGLYYYRARMYSPSLGRFLQVDPSNGSGSGNRYAYVGNDPINVIDPSGLVAEPGSGSPYGTLDNGGQNSSLFNTSYAFMSAPSAVTGVASVAGGGGVFGPAVALAVPLALSGDTCATCNQDPFYYATYTRANPVTDQVYSGRTSGYGDPYTLVQRRGAQQPILTGEGFSSPVLDQAVMLQQDPNAYAAIRGREQQLIDFNGGAQSVGGTSRNMINGISEMNPLRDFYIQQSINRFGALPDNSPRTRGQ